MKLTISKTRTFIPEFNGNKDCSPTEQIVVTIKNPTIAIKDKVSSKPETVARADANGRVEGIDISLKTDDVAVLRNMVEKITNCSYEEENGKEIQIVSVQDLLAAPIQFAPLMNEILAECNKALNESEINEKN